MIQVLRNKIGGLLGYATCGKCGNTLWAVRDYTSPYLGHLHSSNSICEHCHRDIATESLVEE